MKKLTVLISALALLLSLCACSSQARGAGGGDISLEPGTAPQAVNKNQGIEPGKDPSVTPVLETNAPKSGQESRPPADASEASAPVPEPAPAPAPDPVSAKPPASAPAPVPDPVPAKPSAPAPDPKPDPAPAPEPDPVPAADPKATAQGLIGRPVSELYAAIGKPISSDYAPGCLEPDSEDGELVYNGFVVYTVRTATREYVYDVL